MEDLKRQIEAVNEYTDRKKVGELRNRIDWLNIYDPKTKEIVQLARDKGIY